MESITFNYPNDMNFDDEIAIEKKIIKGRRDFHTRTNWINRRIELISSAKGSRRARSERESIRTATDKKCLLFLRPSC